MYCCDIIHDFERQHGSNNSRSVVGAQLLLLDTHLFNGYTKQKSKLHKKKKHEATKQDTTAAGLLCTPVERGWATTTAVARIYGRRSSPKTSEG